MDKRTLLLTGATGYLGSAILRRLIQNFRVVATKRSTSNLNRVSDILSQAIFYNVDEVPISKIFKDNQIHLIIHCATSYDRGSCPLWQVAETNLIFPIELMKHAILNNVLCFVNADTILEKEINNYSLSKAQFREWFKLFAKDLVCINMTMDHFYGPFDDRTKFITWVISELIKEVEQIDLTEGKQKRDFTFVDDVVNAFVAAIDFSLNAKRGFYNFQIGSNRTIELRKLVELLKNLTGNRKTHLNFGALPYRSHEVMESKIDTSALVDIGWKPVVLLEDGLSNVIHNERAI